MLISIGLFLLQAISDFFVFVFLLRAYSFFIKLNIGSYSFEIARFVYAITDRIVLPLRRILPQTGQLDISSILPAFFIQLPYVLMKSWLWAGQIQILNVVLESLVNLSGSLIRGLIGILFLSVILSWIQPNSTAHKLSKELSEPILSPLRRLVPQIGGVDISPLLALLLLQIAQKLLSSIVV